MKPEKKAEKITGYMLLVIGLILIIVPALLALWMFLSGAQIPQLVVPTGETNESTKSIVIFSNVCLIFFIFIIIVWAGSIISSRGLTLIKDVKLKLVGKSLREAAEVAEKVKG
jgi:sterol desaturase/sphingolipid hydroxylase (fatty acid hydroxylase superfamily)